MLQVVTESKSQAKMQCMLAMKDMWDSNATGGVTSMALSQQGNRDE